MVDMDNGAMEGTNSNFDSLFGGLKNEDHKQEADQHVDAGNDQNSVNNGEQRNDSHQEGVGDGDRDKKVHDGDEPAAVLKA